jgi:hypothetical protein
VARWERTWELELPASTVEQHLRALLIRDLIHGTSFDVELEGTESMLAVDFEAGDELEDEVCRLLILAEIDGPRLESVVEEVAADALEEMVGEADQMLAARQPLASMALSDLDFRPVPQERERWDLVIPDWLAPDGAEVPFGFRCFVAESGEDWPPDDLLDAHGRVILVPEGEVARLFGVPPPPDAVAE